MSSGGALRRVSVRVGDDRAEAARAVMIDLFPEGFEEVQVEGGLELAAYTGAGGEERVWQVFGPGRADDVDDGWAVAWRHFHRPVRIGPLWIGPPWEEPDEGALRVVVDPGQAFGTGSHPTTRLCLELLLAEEPRGALLDLGCGSGVLAIAAARLGFAPVVALDHDEAAVHTAREGVKANGVDVEVRRADVRAGDLLPPARIAVANITCDAVEKVAERLEAERLLASGYLLSDAPAPTGWRRVERREFEGWAADVLEPLP